MTLNELLTKQNVITKLLLQSCDKELSKELKVKIMRIKMAYNKAKQQFDSDTQEFTSQLVTDELKTLANKANRTEEETARFEELNTKVNAEYQEFLIQKGLEEVKNIPDDTFTLDEYFDIVDVNSGNDVVINGNTIKAMDLLDIIMTLFVKE